MFQLAFRIMVCSIPHMQNSLDKLDYGSPSYISHFTHIVDFGITGLDAIYIQFIRYWIDIDLHSLGY